MKSWNRPFEAAEQDKEARRQAIREKFGADFVGATENRLCTQCAAMGKYGTRCACKYNVLPITSEGKDCPYWQKKEISQ